MSFWMHQYSSGQSSTDYAFPTNAYWIQVFGAGTIVLDCGGGVTFTRNAVGGEIYPGDFLSLTSTTCQYVVLGNGPIPTAVPPSGTAAGVTVVDSADYFTGDQTEEVLAEIGLQFNSALGVIPIKPSDFYLLTGAPLAIFADGASTVPGSVFIESEGFAVQWNNDAAPAAITTSFMVPPDMDIASNAVLHFRVAKIGATNNAGNTTTLAVGLFNQVDGSTYIADADYGGASSALVPNATTKTLQNLTLTALAANLAAYPASTTITIKPTAGTLDTDDLLLFMVYVVYQKKPVIS